MLEEIKLPSPVLGEGPGVRASLPSPVLGEGSGVRVFPFALAGSVVWLLKSLIPNPSP